jgi:ubiquinone/menaquinone biosynthesis C-methylase UbiE
MRAWDWRRQFAKPTGVLGALVGHLMAAKNRERSEWVLGLLDVAPGDRVLEVGFGSGVDVGRTAARACSGYVAGVDHSEVMVQQARRRNAAAIAAGRVQLELGSATCLPWPDQAFDKAFAVNVAQFWGDGSPAVSELRRVLRPGGLLALAVQPRSKGATEETARQTGASLLAALAAAGFEKVRLESKALRPVSVVCALGLKPAEDAPH